MSESREQPPNVTSIFEAARLGWNVKFTCWNCGHVRVLHAAALWLKMSLKGKPDHLMELKRYGKCVPCFKERDVIIGGPKVELTREKLTGDPLPLPTERQWKDGMKWQRR
ncbi:MAG TPA: hypothetical protein VGD10_09540 [Allosphingosinicella sp.]|uniref:hypothetical protein n=1 Tax=Allosphingosinicella sp. TaxID=2823234 RepID=UPI002ED90ED6